MSQIVEGNPWVWIVVLDPGGDEQFMGQHDEEKDISFIPAFLEKEEAIQGAGFLTREKGRTYEVQAIQYEELAGHAADNGFMIFLLNGAGQVLEKIQP